MTVTHEDVERWKKMPETGQNRVCSFCRHHSPCKYMEKLNDLLDDLNVRDETRFKKWLDHYAIYCEYFELDGVELGITIKCGLETVFFEKPLTSDSDRSGKQ